MKEPVNTWTHLGGFMLGVMCLILLLVNAGGELPKLVTMSIYGVSVLLLYASSTVYHWIRTTPKNELLLRKIDHIAIFVLISGSYTPVFYYGLEGSWRVAMLSAVWGIAVLGVFLKLFFMKLPRSVSTAFYVLMGWIALIPLVKLIHGLPLGALLLILAGGLAYTLGGIIYATKKLQFFSGKLGFHEIFHVFVLLGTTLHFLMIFFYILPM
jgi:hemolysin III